jgi:hypothetical protein
MIHNLPAHTDARGVAVSECKPSSLEDYERALYQFQSYFGDPTETLATTVENDPEFVMGHVFNASAMLMMTERQYIPAIRQSIVRAESLSYKSNDREKGLIAAARDGLEGRWDQACATWDRVLERHPRDAMAIQCAHLMDFFRGDAVNLRDRVGRVIRHWHKSIPGYSYILGMQAFGFEECNQYDKAEETANNALEIECRDGWSVHALAHVMEMQSRYEEGKDLMRSRVQDWAPDNGFAFHNWWHLALFHIEHEDFPGAFRLYDEKVIPEDSDVTLQMLDATALLWRLHLQGADAGERWNRIADMWARKAPVENGYYAFNDLHAVISFLGAGRIAEARTVLAAVKAAAEANLESARRMAREVGIPACSAFLAFAEERYTDAVELLLPIRTIAHRFGGSHAQRDILTQTLIESAIRGDNTGLASNLMSERTVHKPFSPLTRRFNARVKTH